MANFFDQFDAPEQNSGNGNFFDQFDEKQPGQAQDAVFLSRAGNAIGNLITGADRETEQSRSLDEVRNSAFVKNAGARLNWIMDHGSEDDQLKALTDAGALVTSDARGNKIVNIPARQEKMGWLASRMADALAPEIQAHGGEMGLDAEGNRVINYPAQSFILNKPGISGQDVKSFVSDALLYAPAGAAGAFGKGIAATAATEAAKQYANYKAGGAGSLAKGVRETGLAAGLDAVTRGGGRAIGAVWRGVKGEMSPAAKDAVKFAEDNKVPLMTTDLIAPATSAGKHARTAVERIPFAGTGGLRSKQQEAREKLVHTFSDEVGGISDSELYKSASAGQQAFIEAAGKRYNRIIDAMGDTPVDINNTVKEIDNQIAKLTRPGISQDRSAVNVLSEFKDDISSGVNTLAIARENRTNLRKRFMAASDEVDRDVLEKASDAVYKAYTRDMLNSVKINMGEQEAAKMYRADRSWAGFNDMMSNTRVLKAIKNGRINPEDVTKLIFSQKSADRSQLYRLLDEKGRQNARGALIQNAMDKSIAPDGKVSVEKFINEMHRTRKQAGTFFKGEHGKRLDGVIKYLDSTREAATAAAHPLNGQLTAGMLTGGAGILSLANPATIPYVIKTAAGGGIVGGAGRAYESKKMRNFLLRLANTPKGSRAFEHTVKQIDRTANLILQSEKE